jgi:hypothetical protein
VGKNLALREKKFAHESLGPPTAIPPLWLPVSENRDLADE